MTSNRQRKSGLLLVLLVALAMLAFGCSSNDNTARTQASEAQVEAQEASAAANSAQIEAEQASIAADGAQASADEAMAEAQVAKDMADEAMAGPPPDEEVSTTEQEEAVDSDEDQASDPQAPPEDMVDDEAQSMTNTDKEEVMTEESPADPPAEEPVEDMASNDGEMVSEPSIQEDLPQSEPVEEDTPLEDCWAAQSALAQAYDTASTAVSAQGLAYEVHNQAHEADDGDEWGTWAAVLEAEAATTQSQAEVARAESAAAKACGGIADEDYQDQAACSSSSRDLFAAGQAYVESLSELHDANRQGGPEAEAAKAAVNLAQARVELAQVRAEGSCADSN